MASRVLADAIIVISPDTRFFRTKTDTEIRKALAGFNPKIRIGADTKSAVTAVESFKARVKAMSEQLQHMRMDIKGDKAAEAKIAYAQAKVLALTKAMQNMTMAGNTKKLDAQIVAKEAEVRKLEAAMSGLQMDADATRLALKIAEKEVQAKRLEEQLHDMDMDADVSVLEAKFNAVHAELALLKRDASDLDLVMGNVAALRNIAVVKAELASLQQQARDTRLGVEIDPVKLAAAEAGLTGIEAVMQKLAPAATTGDVALGVLGKAITGTGTGWGFLTRDVALFGGVFNRVLPVILSSVKVWHVLADAIIEVGAVWVPAALAVGAFAAAASDAAVEVQRRMQAMHTELDATGRSIPGLTSGMEKLHKAVRPQVFQLFGDAITIMRSRTGEFATIAKSTGTVIDQLAARVTFAITSNKSFSKFASQAVTDVAKLGDSIGNVFGIFGNFFKAIPGFAAGLLTIGDDFTKVLEAASAAAVPVLKWTLLLHGYILYTGLAVSATLAFIGGVANLARQFFTFAAGSVLAGVGAIKAFVGLLKTGALFIYDFVTAVAALAAEEGILVAAQELLAAVNPFVWVGAAVVALGALVFWMARSKDAAQSFNDSMQKMISSAQLTNLVSTIQGAQAQTTAKLAQANTDLNKALASQGPAVTGIATRFGSNYSPAVDHAAQSVRELTAGQKQIAAQAQLVSGRFGALTKQFGSQAAALGILNAAGITTAQITDTNKDHWAQALIQVNSTVAAYKTMGTQAGTLGNDLDVLGRPLTDQYKAVQTLNQGWGQFITDVTGTQGAFDTVAQGFFTLNDHAGKLHFTLGKLKVAYADANVAIDSLTPAGVALNQAFGDQVGNLDKLFASWRTAGLAGNLFTAGVKDAIGPLVKYARGSQEATAQLVALAQEAGYQGPISMQALTKWLGNTHGATKRLKDITNQATTQEALLTGAMQDQGNYIANKLIGDINNAILNYDHVRDAAKKYGDAIAQSGRQSDAAHAARQTLITDIINSGRAAGDTTGQIAAMIGKVLGIPKSEALRIVMIGTGTYTVHGALFGTTGQPIPQPGLHPHAAGGYIGMGSGPTADDVPIMASRGEYVVRAASVAKYGKGTMDAINSGAFADGGPVGRYAGGGLVKAGMLDVLSGQYAVNSAQAFQQSMISTETAAMKAAIRAGKAADAKAQAGLSVPVGNVGSGVARWAGLVRKVLAYEHLNPNYILDVLYQMQTESGGNPNAINLTDINAQRGDPSRGLMQTIMSTFLAYHWPGTSYNIYDPEANIAAALNYGAHNGRGFGTGPGQIGSGHGYAAGGIIQKLAAGGLIGMASGGQIPLARYLPQLRAAQGHEYHDYTGLRAAYLADLAHARKGSWTSGHKAGIRSELGTLVKRQSAEEAAYDNILHHGTARANLSKFRTRVREVRTTSRDKDLTHSHPAWTHSLQYWLGVLTHLADPAVAPAYTGSQELPKMQFSAWITRAKAYQAHERHDELGLQAAFRTGLSHARKGTWLYAHRSALRAELSVLGQREAAETAAFTDLVAHSSGSVADLDKLQGRVSTLGTRVSAVAAAGRKADLSHLPGGHPGWVKGMEHWLSLLAGLARSHPFNPPWNPGNLGPSHTVTGGVLQFDTGRNVLAPGLNLAWNGTGRTEALSSSQAGGSQAITLEFAGGGGDLEQLLFQIIRRTVRVRGGGSVQTAYGRGS